MGTVVRLTVRTNGEAFEWEYDDMDTAVRVIKAILTMDGQAVTGWGIDTVNPKPHCTCGDPECNCYCVPGEYPCEHGSMGEGCGG
jgi:hypothetical protein